MTFSPFKCDGCFKILHFLAWTHVGEHVARGIAILLLLPKDKHKRGEWSEDLVREGNLFVPLNTNNNFRSRAPCVDSEQEPCVQTDGGQLQAAHRQQPEQCGRHGRDQGPRVGHGTIIPRGLSVSTVFCFSELARRVSGWERDASWQTSGRTACTSYKAS